MENLDRSIYIISDQISFKKILLNLNVYRTEYNIFNAAYEKLLNVHFCDIFNNIFIGKP